MKYYVYKLTNKTNGKIYIGFHGSNKDFLEDNYYGSGFLIKKALEKYGKENFYREVLFVYESEEEAKEMERSIVNEEFLNRKDVYNLALGGSGGGLLGEKNPFFGKKHSEETLQILSDKGKERTHTEETREKISNSLKNSEKYKLGINEERSVKISIGRRINSGKNILCYVTPLGKFQFSTDAAKTLNIPWRSLIKRCEQSYKKVSRKEVKYDKTNSLNSSMIGKSWKELGWGFEEVNKDEK